MEEKKTNTDLGHLQTQEGRYLWRFPSILWAIASVYLSEILTKSPGMLTHLLTLANAASESTHPGSHLLSPADYPVLLRWLVSSVLLSDLLSLIFFRSRGRSRAQALCVGFAPKQTKGYSDWHLPTPISTKRMPTSCHCVLLYNYAHILKSDIPELKVQNQNECTQFWRVHHLSEK